jgi:hypothetical protein
MTGFILTYQFDSPHAKNFSLSEIDPGAIELHGSGFSNAETTFPFPKC